MHEVGLHKCLFEGFQRFLDLDEGCIALMLSFCGARGDKLWLRAGAKRNRLVLLFLCWWLGCAAG